MKINTLFSILFLISSITIYAQGGRFREKKDQIKAMKVAYLTNELKLTVGEAEKFWSIYNTFDDKQFELRHQKMKVYANRLNEGSLDDITDKEALVFLNQMESTDEELYLIRKKFNAALRNILSPKKIIMLRKAEISFDRKLLQKYRDIPMK